MGVSDLRVEDLRAKLRVEGLKCTRAWGFGVARYPLNPKRKDLVSIVIRA